VAETIKLLLNTSILRTCSPENSAEIIQNTPLMQNMKQKKESFGISYDEILKV
jgi:hypothetical protein